VLPILNIYRKYYGLKIAAFLFVTMYVSMTLSALIIELIFKAVGLVPVERHAKIVETAIQWNNTTILNIIFLILAAVLLIRSFRTGGLKMLKRMDEPPAEHQVQHR
jgi:membrane-associated PAP2 superfamily phosphatase